MTEVSLKWNRHNIRAVLRENGSCQIMLKDLMSALGYCEKKSQYNLKTTFRRHLSTFRFFHTGGSPAHVLDPRTIIELLFPLLRQRLCPGQIYCFLAKHKDNFYKFGRTTCWDDRQKGYNGLSEIGKVLLVKNVQNIRSAERKLLTFARTAMVNRIGHEWFQSTDSHLIVEAKLKEFIDTVQLCDGTELDDLEQFLLSYKKTVSAVNKVSIVPLNQ